MKYIIFLFIVIGCNSGKEIVIYQNNVKNCKLTLKEDSSYSYAYPTFFGNQTETGSYSFLNDKIILTFKTTKKKPDIDIGYYCVKDNPDTLRLVFNNIYNQPIFTEIEINGKKIITHNDNSGIAYVTYTELEEKEFIIDGGKVEEILIRYDNLLFNADLSGYENPRKPDRLIFTLNQFKDVSYDIQKRVYELKEDTIRVNDISGKIIGIHNRNLIRQIN